MGFFDNLKTLFSTKEIKNDTKQESPAVFGDTSVDIGQVIAPYFREIPPNMKAGEYLTEGFRSWAYIAINAIADEIATNELTLYQQSGAEWLEVENNPILDLFYKPNSLQTKEEMLWLITVYLLSEGEAPLLLNNALEPD
jgi:hypothetical protein